MIYSAASAISPANTFPRYFGEKKLFWRFSTRKCGIRQHYSQNDEKKAGEVEKISSFKRDYTRKLAIIVKMN
jgi:hypothetical protein